MTKFERVLIDDQTILDMAADCELCFEDEDIESDLILFAKAIKQAVLAKLAEQEPVMFARTYNGEIDWDEDCVTEDDDGLLLDGLTHVNDDGDFEVEEGYAAIPLYAHPCVSSVSVKQACDSQNEKYETQIPDGTLMDEGTKGQHRSIENHILDVGEMIEQDADKEDAERYRYLRNPKNDVALVLDKRTGYVPEDAQIQGIGGYHTYEYRAGKELDAAIDTAIQRASVFDDGGDGVDPESARGCNEILKGMILSDGTLIDEGTKEHHKATESHIPDAGKMIEHESHSLEFEVRTMVEMLEAKEWAEHCGKSDLGQRLEWAITSLHNEAQIIPKIIPDGWQLVPKEPTEEMHSLAVNFITNAPDCMWLEYVKGLYSTLLAAAPKYEESKK